MNVLSLFDGMSCGQIALRELGIKVDRYFASEIDKHAIAQTQLNFPDTIQLGDVRNVHAKDLPKIDLLISGSPCQGFSFAGKQLNFDDPRSKLFFDFVRILRECREINPSIKFLLENVRMKREYEQVISDTLGIKPVMINSALVSAQNRVRLYWSNICATHDGLFDFKTDIPQPADRGLTLADILEEEVDKKYYISGKTLRNMAAHAERQKAKGNGFGIDIRRAGQKSCTITVGGKNTTDVVAVVQRPRGYYNKCGIFTDKLPTLSANSWEQDNILCISSNQAHATTSINKSSPLVAAMGMGGGHVPMIVKREVRKINPNTVSSGKQSYQQNCDYSAGGIAPGEILRRLTPTECARLQTIPEWYKWGCSVTQQYKMLGNGWTVEVIKHIFSFLDFERNTINDKHNQQ